MKLKVPQHVMLKLRVWRDLGDTEVTGFFVTKRNDISTVLDAFLVEATCTGATVNITPEAMATFYQNQIDQKIYPDQLMVWWHTHPGNSAHPSGTDEATFRALGKDRSLNVMYILACGGQEFAQLSVTDKKSQYMVKESVEISHPIIPWIEMPSYDTLVEEYNTLVNKVSFTPQYAVINTKSLTQREIFEKNQSMSPDILEMDAFEAEHVEILDQLDTEYACAKTYPDFLEIAQDMLRHEEVTDVVLNKWFEDNNLKTRSKGAEIGR